MKRARISWRLTSVEEAARIMRARFGKRAGRVARDREDRAIDSECAGFWQRVEMEIERQQVASFLAQKVQS